MNSLLNPEGKLMLLFTKIAYSAYLNVLWFICCLPIVTVGASTTALFYVTLKIAKVEEGNITKSFFRAFRQNFKKATIIWLILLTLGIILALDGYIFTICIPKMLSGRWVRQFFLLSWPLTPLS